MNNYSLKLKKNPTMKDFHAYVERLEIIRGFSNEDILEKCLLLGEEVGELFKSIRKEKGIKVDHTNSKFKSISEELADILIFLLSIANRFNINLEDSFRLKEKINKKREWL